MTEMKGPAMPERPSRKACIEVVVSILTARKCHPSLIETYRTLAHKALPKEWDDPAKPPVVPGTAKKWLPLVSVNHTQLMIHLRTLERHGAVDRLGPPSGRYGPGQAARGLSFEPSIAGYPFFLAELEDIHAREAKRERLLERFLEVRNELVCMRHKLGQLDRSHELIAKPLERIHWPRRWPAERLQEALDDHLRMLADVVKAVSAFQPEEEADWRWNDLAWRQHRLEHDRELSGGGGAE